MGSVASDADKQTILLVDDEERILHLGKKVLERLGYEPLIANSGTDALDIFEQRHADIDLVILDLSMPVLDGSETFSRMQQIDPGVAVLICSGYCDDSGVQALLDRGACFLEKPYRINTLSDGIRRALQS